MVDAYGDDEIREYRGRCSGGRNDAGSCIHRDAKSSRVVKADSEIDTRDPQLRGQAVAEESCVRRGAVRLRNGFEHQYSRKQRDGGTSVAQDVNIIAAIGPRS